MFKNIRNAIVSAKNTIVNAKNTIVNAIVKRNIAKMKDAIARKRNNSETIRFVESIAKGAARYALMYIIIYVIVFAVFIIAEIIFALIVMALGKVK